MSKQEWITVRIEQPPWRVSSRWFQNAVEFCKRVGGIYDATTQTWDIPKAHAEVQSDLAMKDGLMNHCLAVVSMNDAAQEMSGDQAMAAYQAGMNEGGDGYNPYWEGASASPGTLQPQPAVPALPRTRWFVVETFDPQDVYAPVALRVVSKPSTWQGSWDSLCAHDADGASIERVLREANPGTPWQPSLSSAGLNTAIEQAILAGKNFETARLAPPPTAPGTEWVEILYVPHTLQAGVSWGSDPDWSEAASIDEAYAQFFAQNT